ncbi:MAG: hypothetical protein ABL921_03145 [Pirellula sp.]
MNSFRPVMTENKSRQTQASTLICVAFASEIAILCLLGTSNLHGAPQDSNSTQEPAALSATAAPATARADSLGEKTERLKHLVADLASPQFLVREAATEKLTFEFDEKQLPLLQLEAERSTDAEARVRLGSIIARFKAERLQNQIRNFKRSRDPKQTFGFEGWRSFSRYAGESRGAKEIFLFLLEQFPELVEFEMESKESAYDHAKRISSIIGESFGLLKPPGANAAVALMYCVAASEDAYDTDLDRICLRSFKYFEFSTLLIDARFRKCLEPMFNSWALKIKDEILGCLLFAMERDMPVAHDLAIRLLGSDLELEQEFAFLIAMQALYKLGNQSDLAVIEKWLDDKTECAVDDRVDFVRTIQRRDAALLAAMRISGDDPKIAFPTLVPHALTGYMSGSVFRPRDDEESRTKRIEEWRKTRKQEKKAGN